MLISSLSPASSRSPLLSPFLRSPGTPNLFSPLHLHKVPSFGDLTGMTSPLLRTPNLLSVTSPSFWSSFPMHSLPMTPRTPTTPDKGPAAPSFPLPLSSSGGVVTAIAPSVTDPLVSTSVPITNTLLTPAFAIGSDPFSKSSEGGYREPNPIQLSAVPSQSNQVKPDSQIKGETKPFE